MTQARFFDQIARAIGRLSVPRRRAMRLMSVAAFATLWQRRAKAGVITGSIADTCLAANHAQCTTPGANNAIANAKAGAKCPPADPILTFGATTTVCNYGLQECVASVAYTCSPPPPPPPPPVTYR